jgi:stage V sporulation protein AF
MITLGCTYLLKIWGFALGLLITALFIIFNNTPFGKKYLYPLSPFNGRALLRLLIRERKKDFDEEG